MNAALPVSEPVAPVSSPSFAQRALRFLALLILVLAYLLLLTIAIIPVAWMPKLDATGGWLILGVLLLAPVGLRLVVKRLQPRPWAWMGLCYLALAPIFAYLANDDAVLRHPITLDEIAPAFPGAEKSFEVFMRYGKDHALGRDFSGPMVVPPIGNAYANFADRAAWGKYVLDQRATLEANWRAIEPVHAWWQELSTFDRIGDLTQASPSAEVIAFAPVRVYSQHVVAIASLRAIDGRGDEAMAIVLPLLEVSRKLEPSSRTLVRFMIARVVQRMAIQTATYVLDTTDVSAANRARLLAAASGGSGGEAGARRMVSIDYAQALGGLKDVRLGEFVVGSQFMGPKTKLLPLRMLNVLSPIAYNPRRTFNILGDFIEQLQELAARREIEKLGPAGNRFVNEMNRPRFKNVAGGLLGSMLLPAYVKVVDSYWKIEDERAALRNRLTPP